MALSDAGPVARRDTRSAARVVAAQTSSSTRGKPRRLRRQSTRCCCGSVQARRIRVSCAGDAAPREPASQLATPAAKVAETAAEGAWCRQHLPPPSRPLTDLLLLLAGSSGERRTGSVSPPALIAENRRQGLAVWPRRRLRRALLHFIATLKPAMLFVRTPALIKRDLFPCGAESKTSFVTRDHLRLPGHDVYDHTLGCFYQTRTGAVAPSQVVAEHSNSA